MSSKPETRNSKLHVTIPFTKMVGTGNDFIIVDARRDQFNGLSRRWSAVSQELCDRHNGIGADGILVLQPSRAATAKMRVFNPDGSEAEMCGNGARCVALYLAQLRHATRDTRHANVTLETLAGMVPAEVRGNRVAMRMTDPTELQLNQTLEVNEETVRYGFVNTGVPHLVVPVPKLDALDVNRLGPPLRYHRRFAPRGANVNFIQWDARRNCLLVRTYERGVEDETLACGTGVVAAAILHALQAPRARTYRIEAQPKSGDRLIISFSVERDGPSWRISDVIMDGPAQRVFDGEVLV